MAEARAVKFIIIIIIYFVQRENISSLAKGAWFCSRDPFLYAQLELEKILHGTR